MAKRHRYRRSYRPRFLRRRRKNGMTIPLAPIAGLAYGLVPGAIHMAEGDFMGGINMITRGYTGFDMNSHDFGWMRLSEGALPLVLGLLVHKFVGGRPINANAALSRANVPFIRI